MVTIEPVGPDDAEKLCQEFFAPDSLAERLGSDGHWQGMGVGRLGLADPVQEAAFANLLAGRTPDGTQSLLADAPGPERPAAWRLRLDTSPSVSVLWAMAPPASRGIIERVHAECVEAALIDFEQQLCHHAIGAPQPIADQFLGGLFASFRQGAAWDQTPRLHTTVFCMNLGLGPDGQAHGFQPRQVLETKAEVSPYYRGIIESGLLDSLGPFHKVACEELRLHGVPQELCRRFLLDPGFANPVEAQGPARSRALRGEELFARWRQQGREFGWGPAQAQALLDHLDGLRRWEQLKDAARSKVSTALEALFGRSEGRKPPTQGPAHGSKPRRSRPSQSQDQGHSY